MAAVLRSYVACLVVGVALGGHNDMFSCRGKGPCEVTEFSERNWASKLGEEPHFVMFYAPWCGHCKVLAPKMKAVAKKLKGSGVGIGAVDVEPNQGIQQMFPDIRGFPSLKYVRSGKNSAKTAIDYNGPREADDIERWTKEQFKKFGGALAEPVEAKQWNDLYTFHGRAALDDAPVLFLVGGDGDTPAWFSKVHAGLKATPDAATTASPEAETVRLLKEARAATKSSEVKQGVDDLLETIENAERAAKSKGKPLFAAAYGADAPTRAAFNATALDAGHYAAFVAALDRKNLQLSAVAAFPGNPLVVPKRAKKPDQGTDALEAWARAAAADANAGVPAFKSARETAPLPDFPKPASVLAAEERAAKKKAKASAVASLLGAADLESECYGLSGAKTCVVGVGASIADLAPLAAKYAREGFQFSALDANAPVADALLGQDPPTDRPALVVVKAGKRPRAARAFGADAFAGLLDNVLGGGATFAKFPDGLPQWPQDEATETGADGPQEPAEDDTGDDYDL